MTQDYAERIIKKLSAIGWLKTGNLLPMRLHAHIHEEIRAAQHEAIERCASVCNTESMGKDIVCPEECAAAIRALADDQPQEDHNDG